ncbi:hypothetical protein [Arenibacter certesii]|uniref:DUF4878 domain-containing protein n=1 Tax=Arenibacter certesii TaxID=228955 RepID=A0A918IX88_9FLAO|nr:hypothetical protein [Arenibacter certesii]GGW36461.1 hypothetical protein GCM10007383_21780 [Arenibacter certesii]
MKALIIPLMALLLTSCTTKQDFSHTETAKIVVESFYHGDKITLEKHTTPESYTNFISLQGMFVEDENSASDFKVIDEFVEGSVAWVKYSTAYDEKPGIFKLVKEDEQWKVTERRPREKVPF